MLLSERLKHLLKEKKLTSKQLAKDLGLSEGTVSGWHSGKSSPSPETLIGISEILGVSIDYLLGITDNPNLSFKNLNDEGVSLDIAKRFDALDADGKVIVTGAIIKEERRIKDPNNNG